jgi:hypothetical protein
MFASASHPVVALRSRTIVTIVYGFGDASGTGLEATFTCGSALTFRVGVWGAGDNDQSSNWKEFANAIGALKDEAELGNLTDSEVPRVGSQR